MSVVDYARPPCAIILECKSSLDTVRLTEKKHFIHRNPNQDLQIVESSMIVQRGNFYQTGTCRSHWAKKVNGKTDFEKVSMNIINGEVRGSRPA